MGLHPLTDCESCPLYNKAEFLGYNTPDHGSYDVVMVGGLPNRREKFLGGFFNTEAGKLVRRVFKHFGKSPSVYYTPAVLCRPYKTGKTQPKTPVKAVSCCRPRVIVDIKLASKQSEQEGRTPPVVVTLGAEAAASVLGAGSVATLRVGPAKVSEWLSSYQRVIPTVNPWVCMKQGAQFPSFVTDIGKIWTEADPFIAPKYQILPDENEAIIWFTRQDNYTNPTVTIDIECSIDKEESFGHPERHQMLCVGLKVNDDDPVVLTENALTPIIWKELGSLLRRSRIIAQNGKFDLNGIRPYVGKLELWFDTMLAHYALDERSGVHGLKSMAQEYLGAPAYDDAIKPFLGTTRDFTKVPKHLLYKYNAYDVECTYRLYVMFNLMLLQQGVKNVHELLCKASGVLADIEYDGIFVDKDYLNKLVDDFAHEIMLKRHHLSVMAYEVNPKGYVKGDGINPNSPLQIKKLFADLGVNLDSTDEATMQQIIDYQVKFPVKDELIRKFASMLLEYRGEVKLNDTYILGAKDRLYKGRVNSSYLLHGTTTGRLSSRNPNLQNIPRQSPIKKMYIASDKDHVIIQSDYSQAELRVLSYLAGDTYFRDIFNAGDIDVFDELVPVLFPGSSKSKLEPALWKERRTMVKTYVYGLSYGRTEYGIAAGFGIPVTTAKKHMQSFFSVIPEIITWQRDVQQQVLDGEDLITPYGRHRRYTLITDENRKDILNEALAFIPQSTASDMCLSAAIDLNNKFKGAAFIDRPKIVNLVHDAIMTECHINDAQKVMKVQEDHMITSAYTIVKDYVAFKAESSYGNSWGDLK